MKSIGMIELNSIAKGILATDHIGKAANVKILRSHSVCPGKYIVIFSGDVGAVEASKNAGVQIGGSSVINSFIIANVHESVIDAINGTLEDFPREAIGVIEYFSISSAVQGADDVAKASNVTLVNVRLGFAIGGKSYITLTGKVSAVEEAVKAGVKKAQDDGLVVDYCVLPSPIDELYNSIL
ncbi:BMC domain-containing protein [uncultured Brachyspira sp.]|uniref:BMC domain-containing protein n=1 Tax=uncultured Brachyspira sp. TaxID=221953 RepID=UPI002611135B|nr:BMC domain-containing protein [uncultured Brachyspira sp.]